MKKLLRLMLCLVLMLGVTAYSPVPAEAKALTTGKCGSGVTYSFDSTTGALTISGKGSMADYGPNSNKSPFSGREEILSVKVEDGVTSVGQWAFYDCFGLRSAELGKDVKTISDWAFYGCVELADAIMQPDSVTYIGAGSFMHCKAMMEITLPDSVVCVARQAFDDTGYYQNWNNWENGVLYIGNCLYSGVYNCEYTDPNSRGDKTKPYGGGSGGAVSMDRSKMVSGNYTIKEGTTVIAVGAFKYAGLTGGGLTGVTIPGSVTRISDSAFADTNLESITIPVGITEIGSDAFSGCNSLKTVTIPKSVKVIGNGAFSYCKSLEKITIKKGVALIEDEAFYRCESLKKVTIPKSVKSIGNEAFYRCESLKTVTIKGGVRAVGEMAFEYCDSLTSVTVPKSVTIINARAFGRDGSWKIKGYKGSAAQEYAKENNLKFVEIKK